MRFSRFFSLALSTAAPLLAGTSASLAAFDDRDVVLAYVASDFFDQYFRHPDVESEYGDPGFAADELLERSGAFSLGADRVGTAEDKVVATALVGRAFILRGDRAGARPRLESALAAAGALGWDDRRANGILRDLAWLDQADARPPGDFAVRAETCPAPCAEDAVAALYDAAGEAQSRIYDTLGNDVAYSRISDTLGEDMIAFVDATFGPESLEAAGAWHSRAFAARQQRPWKALDDYQRLVEVQQAAGSSEETILDTRRAIAQLLLQAGEYRRLATYAEALLPDALEAARRRTEILYLPSVAMDAARLRARALWHLDDPEARAAYGVAIDIIFQFGASEAARDILPDLVDAGYREEITRVADAILSGMPGDTDALYAKARVAAWDGDYAGAAALIGQMTASTAVSQLQQAAYLDEAGQGAAAAEIRARIPPIDPTDFAGWGVWSELRAIMDPRDLGAYEGAAEAAKAYLALTERMVTSGTYLDAQQLWQLAYTLARGGSVGDSFRLMKDAASIAARLSFADANDTDGGSLQLLRRDRFRYLLFVDIAWAAVTGAPPDSMSVSSRY